MKLRPPGTKINGSAGESQSANGVSALPTVTKSVSLTRSDPAFSARNSTHSFPPLNVVFWNASEPPGTSLYNELQTHRRRIRDSPVECLFQQCLYLEDRYQIPNLYWH